MYFSLEFGKVWVQMISSPPPPRTLLHTTLWQQPFQLHTDNPIVYFQLNVFDAATLIGISVEQTNLPLSHNRSRDTEVTLKAFGPIKFPIVIWPLIKKPRFD